MPVVAGQNQQIKGLNAQPAAVSPTPSPEKKSGGILETVGKVASKGNLPFTAKDSSNKFFSGGLLSDIGDVLQAPQFALTGLLSGKGVKKGIEERISPSKAMNIQNPYLGFAADVVLDPLNLAFGAGILSKGAKLAQLPGLASKLGAAEKLGSVGMVTKGAQKILSPVTDIIGPKIEPVIRKGLTGAEPLSNAEKLRATQITKGGIAGSETSQKIVEATKPLSEVLSEKVGGFKLFETKGGTPVTLGDIGGMFKDRVPSAFKGARSTLETKIAEGAEKAIKIGETLTSGLSKAQQQRLGQIVKGGISVSEKEKPLRVIAGMARRTVDDLSNELTTELKTGGMGQSDALVKSVLNNIGTYMPRLYREFVEDPANLVKILGDKKSARVIRDRFMKREDIPEDIRKQMGEILEPGFPIATGIKQVTQAIETSKFFRYVAKNFADTMNRTGNMVRLADTPALGILRNKYVPKIIADDINAAGNVTKIGDNNFTKAFELYKKLLGYWKFGKVILNPAAQSRNFMSNLILMDTAYYPVFTPQGVKHFTDAATDYANRGELYRLARKVGLIGGTYFGNEIKNLLNKFDDAPTGNLLQVGLKTFFQKAGASYQGVEETSKLAMMKWRMAQGDSAKVAADYAKKWLFDYRDVSPFIKGLRDMPFGFPFITFTSKALPRIAERIVTDPGKISKYYKAFAHIEGEGRAQEEALLPEYIKNGMFVRLPWEDKNGNPLYFNMNYILPWGNLGEASNTFLPSDPAATFFAAAKTGVNPFNQQEIFKDTDDPDEKLVKLVNFVYQTLMPSLAPQIPLAGLQGGYSWEKLVDAIFERPDAKGTLKDLSSTILDVGFGLKAQPINLEEEQVKRTKEFQRKKSEIQQNIRNIARDQSLNDEDKTIKIQKEVEKIQRESTTFSERFGPQL